MDTPIKTNLPAIVIHSEKTTSRVVRREHTDNVQLIPYDNAVAILKTAGSGEASVSAATICLLMALHQNKPGIMEGGAKTESTKQLIET